MNLVLVNHVPHPIFGWLGMKRKAAPLVETLDDYDSHLFADLFGATTIAL
jgi:hypothetical protein